MWKLKPMNDLIDKLIKDLENGKTVEVTESHKYLTGGSEVPIITKYHVVTTSENKDTKANIEQFFKKLAEMGKDNNTIIWRKQPELKTYDDGTDVFEFIVARVGFL
jgi:hypothetical protein